MNELAILVLTELFVVVVVVVVVFGGFVLL